MSVRLPLQGVLDVTNTDLGAGSVAGGYAYPFKIPQDCDNVVVKFTPSVVTGHMGVILQTSDDGGTTWYDVARTSTLSLAVRPEWISAPVISAGVNPIVISNAQAGSVLGGTIGHAAASTLASRQVSGMPILGIQNRAFAILGGGATVNSGSRIQVLVNSQSSSGQ
jgi:hypothetical protein